MTHEERISRAKQMNLVMQKSLNSLKLSDNEATEMADMYPSFEAKLGAILAVGDIVKYSENTDGITQIYSVIQSHTAQADWTPDVALSLFKLI